MGLSWMAWTWQTAVFFGIIAALLVLMTVLEIRRPGGNARDGILGLRTTRGDRLFISLLAAAYVQYTLVVLFRHAIDLGDRHLARLGGGHLEMGLKPGGC